MSAGGHIFCIKRFQWYKRNFRDGGKYSLEIKTKKLERQCWESESGWRQHFRMYDHNVGNPFGGTPKMNKSHVTSVQRTPEQVKVGWSRKKIKKYCRNF